MNATAAVAVVGVDLQSPCSSSPWPMASWQRRRVAPPDARPVRALVRQSRGRPGGHGSLRLGAPLGALAQRPGHRGAACCRRTTCAPTSSATRPMPPMPAALLEAARCAEIVPGARQVGRAAGPAGPAPHPLACGWARAPRASTPCAASAASSASPSRWARAWAWSRSAACWPIRSSAVPELIRGTMTLLVEEIRLLEARIGAARARAHRAGAPSRRRARRCCRSPASACSRPPPWWPPPRGDVSHFRMHGTSPPGSA